MSAISTILTRLRAAIWAIDVRDDIANAIEQCYSDVSNPTLQTEALEAALQEKIDQGEMAALTIGDHTITAEKLANGVIPAADATLTETGKPADAAETGRQIGLIKADLDDKLDKQQQSSDAGKVLKINNDGEIVAGDVFNMRLATALINVLKDVPYIKGDSEKYINGIVSSLEDGEKSLMSISAIYNAGSHTVHQWDSLDSLRDYLTVTAYYDDGSSETVTDYAIYGRLSTANSIVTVGYLARTINVTIPVEIDNSLAYCVTSGTSLSGLDSIDTNVMLSDTNKSVTIVGVVSDAEIATRQRTVIMVSDRASSGSPSYQVYLNTIPKNDKYVKTYSIIAQGSAAQISKEFSSAPHRIKFAIEHYSNATKCAVFLKVDDVVVFNWISVNSTYVATNQTLFIGARPDGGYNWKGRVSLLNVYTRGLPGAEMRSLLGEEA